MGVKRLYQELHRLEQLPLREILDQMAGRGQATTVMVFNGSNERPVAAIALITGPETAQRVEALSSDPGLPRIAVPEAWRKVIADVLNDARCWSPRIPGNVEVELADRILEALKTAPIDEPVEEAIDAMRGAHDYIHARNPDPFVLAELRKAIAALGGGRPLEEFTSIGEGAIS